MSQQIPESESILSRLLRTSNTAKKEQTSKKERFGHRREKSELTKLLEGTKSKSAPDVLGRHTDKDKQLLFHAPVSPCPQKPHSKRVAMKLFRSRTLSSLIEKDVERIFVSEDSEPPSVLCESIPEEATPSPPSLNRPATLSRFHSHLLNRPKLGHTNLENRGVSLSWLIKMFLYVSFL